LLPILLFLFVLLRRRFSKTRQLSYRKDDRAMRPVWVPRKISRVLTSPRLLFPEFEMGVYCDRY